jgi:hypothetical protein
MVDTRHYCAYMLCGWLKTAEDDTRSVWRFRLRDVQSGRQWAFADVQAVRAFLAQEFDQDS